MLETHTQQIIHTINAINSHQIHTNTKRNFSSKIKSMTYPITPKTDINFNYSIYDSESNNNHIDKSHKNGTIFLY